MNLNALLAPMLMITHAGRIQVDTYLPQVTAMAGFLAD